MTASWDDRARVVWLDATFVKPCARRDIAAVCAAAESAGADEVLWLGPGDTTVRARGPQAVDLPGDPAEALERFLADTLRAYTLGAVPALDASCRGVAYRPGHTLAAAMWNDHLRRTFGTIRTCRPGRKA